MPIPSSPFFRAFSHSYPSEFSSLPIGLSLVSSHDNGFALPSPPNGPSSLSTSRVSHHASLFGFALPSLSPSVVSAGAPLTYSRPPLFFSTSSVPTWLFPPTGSSPSAISSSSAPVLNLAPSSLPLSFRSALSGPHRLQWLEGSDNELIKLVETTQTLCPVYFALSPPTSFNPIAKEKWSPLDLTDFYLGTPLTNPQHIKIYVNLYSPQVLSRLSLLPFIQLHSY
jgi:hypothetical protein